MSCRPYEIISKKERFEIVSSVEYSALPTRWPPRTSIFCYFVLGCGCVSLKLSKIFTVLWYVAGCLGCGGTRREETIGLESYWRNWAYWQDCRRESMSFELIQLRLNLVSSERLNHSSINWR